MICNIVRKGVGIGSVLFACATATPSLATSVIDIPVINRDMSSGDIIQPSDITIREIELNRMPRGVVLKQDELVGLELLRSVRPDTPIKSDHVRVPPDTRRGQNVVISFNLPGISMQAQGKALEDGHKGQTIRVMNDASKSIIEVSVTGNGLVTANQ